MAKSVVGDTGAAAAPLPIPDAHANPNPSPSTILQFPEVPAAIRNPQCLLGWLGICGHATENRNEIVATEAAMEKK